MQLCDTPAQGKVVLESEAVTIWTKTRDRIETIKNFTTANEALNTHIIVSISTISFHLALIILVIGL